MCKRLPWRRGVFSIKGRLGDHLHYELVTKIKNKANYEIHALCSMLKGSKFELLKGTCKLFQRSMFQSGSHLAREQ